jgi:hypothetical protein
MAENKKAAPKKPAPKKPATKKTTKATKATPQAAAAPDLQQQLAQALQTIQSLQQMVETQTAVAAMHQSRLSTALPSHKAVGGELMVGIRNISDTTLGVKSPFKGEPDLHLHADFGIDDAGRVTMISYAWWRELRRSALVQKGLIMRDDSVLGTTWNAGPADGLTDVHADFHVNAVIDPRHWIESRTTDQLTEDIAKITSDASLQRLRRAVDQELARLESQYPRTTKPQQVAAAKKALNQLSAKYRHADDLLRTALENPVDADEEPSGPTVIKI